MLLDLDGRGPLYRQVYRALRLSILEGAAAPGSRLPATRVLAQSARVSRNTVLQAFEQLQVEGYVSATTGSGDLRGHRASGHGTDRAVARGPRRLLP